MMFYELILPVIMLKEFVTMVFVKIFRESFLSYITQRFC